MCNNQVIQLNTCTYNDNEHVAIKNNVYMCKIAILKNGFKKYRTS